MMRFAFLIALMPLLAACVHTEPFRDARGRIVPGSIASMEYIPLGGLPQRVVLRGLDVHDPIVILLHGGPGVAEMPLFRHYDAGLERHFLMVYWDQRGAGRSYSSDIPAASMNIEQFVRDLDQLVDTMRSRFGRRRVVLLAHSWGTALGTIYASRHPDKVAAYVGIGQVADMNRGERRSYEFALWQARERGDEAAMDDLMRIGPPPHSVEQMLTSRKWVERFGGSFHGDLSTGKLIWAALRTDEANLGDLIRFGRGNRYSLDHLWPQFSRLDLTGLRSFDVPIIFLLGRHDWQVPAVLAVDYFESISAPCKSLVWFENSGHNPPFEEPERFQQVFVERVTSAIEGCGAARGSQRAAGNEP